MSATAPRSGWFQTPNNTPFGTPKKVALDNPYLSKDEFLTTELAIALGITSSSAAYTNGRLDKVILSASSQINRACRRWFDTQTIDETMTGFIVRPFNPDLVNVTLQNSPYQQILAVYIQVLKWFIQVDIGAQGYLQDFPDYGYYRIVPLLSTAGTGAGSPLPAEIVDKVPLGVLWTKYRFGYGQVQTAVSLTQVGSTKAYQAALNYRLWAPDQTITIYDGGVPVAASNILSYDYPNGIVTFVSAYTPGVTITADFTSNETIPQDIKEACSILAAYMLGYGKNPLGANSISMQTYSITFSKNKDNPLMERVRELLEPYVLNRMVMF